MCQTLDFDCKSDKGIRRDEFRRCKIKEIRGDEIFD